MARGKSPKQVAAYNRLRREYGLSEAQARAFCLRAATSTSRGMTMGEVYDEILAGTLVPIPGTSRLGQDKGGEPSDA